MEHSSSMILGFVLTGHDNRAYFFGPQTPKSVFCPKCGSVLDRHYMPREIDVRTGMDLSSTYDNRDLFSERLRRLCIENNVPGIEFIPVMGRDRTYFFPIVSRAVEYDAARKGTRFERKCTECGQHHDVLSGTPAFLTCKKPLDRGFFRSDLEFGSGKAKSPLLIVDPETGSWLQSEKLSGAEFSPISP
jgi:ribosomal protein S27AE